MPKFLENKMHSSYQRNLISFTFLTVAIFTFNLLGIPANATLPYSKDTGKKCYYCHANQIGDSCVLTEQGVYWQSHNKSFAGMPEELIAGPTAPEKVKNTPFIAMVLGPLVFFGLVAMLIIGIVKKPAVVTTENEKTTSSTSKGKNK